MARKILLDVDPGIDDAVAICLALHEPMLEVVAITATGGTVSPEQSTLNVQAVVEQLDPPRWPRLGCASPDQILRADRRHLFGVDGFCGAHFSVAKRHHQHSSVKVICDEVRSAPGDVTIVATGPLTNIAAALRQQPDLASMIRHLIMLGGTLSGPGNVTAAAEFNIYCDAEAAREVFHSQLTKTLLPIDLTARILLSFDLLENLPAEDSPRGRLLRQLLPGAFRTYRQQLGIEGIHLHDAVAVIAAIEPKLFSTQRMYGDIETEGTLTHGTTILDRRLHPEHRPNLDVVVDLDSAEVTKRIFDRLTQPA